MLVQAGRPRKSLRLPLGRLPVIVLHAQATGESKQNTAPLAPPQLGASLATLILRVINTYYRWRRTGFPPNVPKVESSAIPHPNTDFWGKQNVLPGEPPQGSGKTTKHS